MSTAPTGAVVTTVAVGRPREVAGERGAGTSTAIWKTPVTGRVAVRGVNLDGDDQADRRNHGGVDKAVYAYGTADLAWWAAELEDPDLDPAVFGQNLTVDGTDLRGAVVGERWRVGGVELEVAQPRIPCFKLGLRTGDRTMPRRFVAAERPGAYLRIVAEGELGAGDAVEVTHRPDHGVTVAEAFAVFLRDRERAARLLEAPELPASWHDWARGRPSS